MAFKLAKASGVRVPDMVDHIVAASGLALTEIVNGALVSIISGELDLHTAGLEPAGILVNEVGASRYAAPGSETYSSTFKNKDNVTFIPVTGTLLIEADWDSTATTTPVVGVSYDAIGGLIDTDTVTNTDFRVVRILYAADGTTVSKLLGFFNHPGYFTS